MYSATFGSNSSSSESKARYKAMREVYKYNSNLSTTDYQYLFQKTVNPENLQIWLQCVQSNCGEGPFIETTSHSDSEFILSMGWRIKNINYADIDGEIEVSYSNCNYLKGTLKNGKLLSPINSLMGKFLILDKSKIATVVVKVKGYAEPFKIDVKPLTIPKPTVFSCLPKDVSVLGYMQYDTVTEAVVSTQAIGKAEEGAPENVSWKLTAPQSGIYKIEILILNPYSTNLFIKVFKDIDRNNQDRAFLTKTSFSNFFSKSSADLHNYIWLSVPDNIQLLEGVDTSITFHAPFVYEENRLSVRLPYFKEIRLTKI